jgi:hypothetical protein
VGEGKRRRKSFLQKERGSELYYSLIPWGPG